MFVRAASKTTFTERRRRRRDAGWTLTEFVIAMGLVGLFTLALVGLSMSTGRSFVEITNYVDVDNYNRVALDFMTRDIRQMREVTAFGSHAITFVGKDGQPVAYRYSPPDRTLTRTKNGESLQVLPECDSLEFTAFQRTPQDNSFALYATTNLATIKVVTVRWNCSRRLLGIRANTGQAQQAQIVIRNKNEL